MYVGDGEEREHEVRVNKCRCGEKLDKLVNQKPIFIFHLNDLESINYILTYYPHTFGVLD